MQPATMKLATRLNIVLGMLEIILGIVIGVSLWRMQQIHQHISSVIDINNVEASGLNIMRSAVFEQSLAARDLVLAEDAASARQQAVRLREQVALYLRAEDDLRRMFLSIPETTEHERRTMELIAAQTLQAWPMLERLVAAGLTGDGQARALLTEEMVALQSSRRETLAELARFEHELNAHLRAEAGRAYRLALVHIVILGVVALVLGAVGAWRVAQSLLEELGGEPSYAAALARAIAAGDLTRRVDTGDGDQRSVLAAMRSMTEKMSGLVGRVRRGTHDLVSASAQIANGHLELGARTQRQAESLHQVCSCLGQVTATVRQNQCSAEAGDRLAVDVARQAVQAQQLMGEMAATVHTIDMAASRVFKISVVIEGIAFQTGILALNTAVEASRAGFHGHSVALVANEVSALARRAREAATEIRQLVGDAACAVDAGNRQVGQMGMAVDAIAGRVAEVAQVMRDVTGAARAQAQGMEEIDQAMVLMEEVTRHNVALVGQAAVTAQALLDQARELGGMVATFTVDEGKPVTATPLPRTPEIGILLG